MNLAENEREKYTELWRDIPEYRDHSPGLDNVQRFLDVLSPRRGDTLIDIGCGTGAAGLEFRQHGLCIHWLDITTAGLLPEVSRKSFVQAPLWSSWTNQFKHGLDYGFCCDVMEHIPPEYSMLVIDRILSVCRTTWFQIALTPDKFGEVIGQPLHLTVRPFIWWRDHLASIGKVVEARDLCGVAMFVVKR
jgi:hypothetical protein